MLERLKRSRGFHLAATGEDLDWPQFAAALKWAASTVTDVKNGRALRVTEIHALATMLGVRPGYIAFGDVPMDPATPLESPATKEPERPDAGTPALHKKAAAKIQAGLSQPVRPKDARRSGRGKSA